MTVNAEFEPVPARTLWIQMVLAVVFLGTLISPRPEGMTPAAHRLVAVAVLMAGLWMTQAIPLAVTSLIPLALFPLLGIQSARDTSKGFVEDNLFLYIGGMLLALGIERWQLHRRLALCIVASLGVSPRRLVAGFGLATFGLSMWISNTACAMLMLPIGLAMLKILEDGSPEGAGRSSRLATPLLLMIGWAATLGGMATPVGSPTNAQALSLYESYRLSHPDAPSVSFSEWLLSCAPIALVYLVVTWRILTRQLPAASVADTQLREALRNQLRALGAMSRAESRMAATFLLAAVLWVTRLPLRVGDVTILPGWLEAFGRFADWMAPLNPGGPPFPARAMVSDATVGILLAILLFVIPSGTRSPEGRSVPLMDWPTARRLPWDMILLFGGGFALASGFESTGLDTWLGTALQPYLAGRPAWIVVAAVSLLLIMLTELTSNVATVSAFVPPLLIVAEQLQMDPRMMLIPATLAASAGFMLPVGTPPNAIVFSTGRIPAAAMARQGLILNLLGPPLLTLGAWMILRPVLGIR